jgi:hypothetical protein
MPRRAFGGSTIHVGGDDAGTGLGELLDIDLADPLATAGDHDGSPAQIKTLIHAGLAVNGS